MKNLDQDPPPEPNSHVKSVKYTAQYWPEKIHQKLWKNSYTIGPVIKPSKHHQTPPYSNQLTLILHPIPFQIMPQRSPESVPNYPSRITLEPRCA